jgi:tetratricopeptide (TPR) repeat protein
MITEVCSSASRWLLWNGFPCRPPKGGTTCLFTLAILLFFTTPAKAAQTQPTQLSKSALFLEAQAAYDAGHYAEAAELYEKLLEAGINNLEVEYNLANAYFKNGNLSEAVLHYRRAEYSAPRDPDIRANLHFALNAAGAIEPAPSLVERFFGTLSQNEWIMAAIGAYVIFTLLLFLGLLIRPAKRSLAKLSLLPAALILISGGGWWHWQQLNTHPEWIVIHSGTTALFGPIEDSTAHYKVPLAALVRQRNVDTKGWVEIQYDGKNGWIREDDIHRVSP